jgi:hypothetical protein
VSPKRFLNCLRDFPSQPCSTSAGINFTSIHIYTTLASESLPKKPLNTNSINHSRFQLKKLTYPIVSESARPKTLNYAIYLATQQTGTLYNSIEQLGLKTYYFEEANDGSRSLAAWGELEQKREEIHVQALLCVGNMAILINDAIENNRINRNATGILFSPLAHCIRPPLLDQIRPAASPMDVPMPFTTDEEGTEWRNWLVSKRSNMMAAEYLGAGEWAGFYSFHAYHAGAPHLMNHSLPIFEAPMENIHFEVLGDGEVRGSGRDAGGSFRFSGMWSGAHHGMLTGRKQYAARSFRWDLSMTPFGLYGLWTIGTEIHKVLGGAIWLWKREWTT